MQMRRIKPQQSTKGKAFPLKSPLRGRRSLPLIMLLNEYGKATSASALSAVLTLTRSG